MLCAGKIFSASAKHGHPDPQPYLSIQMSQRPTFQLIPQILRVRSLSVVIFDVLQSLCRILSIAIGQYRDERLIFRSDLAYI